MPVCSVMTCKYFQDDCDPELDGIVFHRFPKNEEMRAKWVDMTGRHDKWVPSFKDVICSRHFRDSDYFIKRSGKRYLKTGAIPCEYVVYKILPDEVVDEVKVEAEAEASEVEEVPVHEEQEPKVVVEQEPKVVVEQEPKVVVQHEPVLDFDMPLEPQPGSSHWFLPQTSQASSSHQMPDSTIATIFDNENSREWERFQLERYFGHRLPASIFEDNSQEVDSSSFDERYRREEGSVNPYPPDLDLRPHLQSLPLPRTPEPVVSLIDDSETNSGFEMEQIPESAPSPVREILRGRQKLEDIKKIMSKRKTSRRAVAAALSEVLEARTANEQLQSGGLNPFEQANAIIDIQTMHIAKLNMKLRRLRKILKRIKAVLRNTE